MFIIKTKDTKSKKITLPYGDGSIYFVEKRNRYAGQIQLLIDGERIRKTVYGKTEREVRNKLKELQIQALAGNLHNDKKPKIPTIFQYAEKMMDEQLALNEKENKNIEVMLTERWKHSKCYPIFLTNSLMRFQKMI